MSREHLDESHLDVIVVGTGITESVLAGALSRCGRKVLHLDSQEFYGGSTSSLPLTSFRDTITRLSVEGRENEGNSDNEDEEARETVEACRKVASGEEAARDAIGRLVISDGVERVVLPTVNAVKAPHRSILFSKVSFDEGLAPIQPPSRSDSHGATHGQEEGSSAGADATQPHNQADGAATTSKDEKGEAVSAEEPLLGWEEIAQQGRDYNLDMAPKLSLSSGTLVRSLLHSGVGRYLEFMPLQSTFMYMQSMKAGPDSAGSLEKVPVSKGEIFQAKMISPIEKRLLMKFLQRCLLQGDVEEAKEGSWAVAGVGVSEDEQLGFKRAVGHVGDRDRARAEQGLEGKTLEQFMTEEKLTENLKRFVSYSIAFTNMQVPATEALTRVQEYAKSLGRYSDSAFLCTYFGVSEVDSKKSLYPDSSSILSA